MTVPRADFVTIWYCGNMVSQDNLWAIFKGQPLFSQSSGVKNAHIEMWYVLGTVDDSSPSSRLFKVQGAQSKVPITEGSTCFQHSKEISGSMDLFTRVVSILCEMGLSWGCTWSHGTLAPDS